MAYKMKLQVVSAEDQIFEGQAEMVFVPASQGEIGIAPHHAPLLTTLAQGEIRVQNDNQESSFFVSGGMLEIQPYVVTVLADTAVRAGDLDEAKAIQAKEAAEKLLADKNSDRSYVDAVAELHHAVAQLRAIERLRKRGR
jgi:F-type H+-transporting ATPase subunit epsilon